MDEQLVMMKHFTQALVGFNQSLKQSLAELQGQHDRVSPIWQDEMRRRYDAVWGPFQQHLKRYAEGESQGYVEFLYIKAYALERYLYGG